MPVSSCLAPPHASAIVTLFHSGWPDNLAYSARRNGRPAAHEVLPRVLAVEKDREDGVCPAGSFAVPPACLGQPRHEIAGGRVRIPPGIGKPDQVGQRVIPERAGDRRVADPETI